MNPAAALLLAALVAPWAVLLLFGVPRLRAYGSRLAPFAALPALFAAVYLPGNGTPLISWGPLSFGSDAVGQAFTLFSAVIWGLTLRFSAAATAAPRRPAFDVLMLAAMGGSFGLLLAQNLFTFYVFFAVASLCAWGLILLGRPPRVGRGAARIYLAATALSEIALLTGIAAAASVDGLAFGSLTPTGHGGLAIAALGVGFGIKLGVLGAHAWLPVAHAAAPLPASAILSAVLVKAGLLGWLRILPVGEAGAPSTSSMAEWAPALAVIGMTATFYGAAVGATRQQAKACLAWSTVSQVGLLVTAMAALLATRDAAPLATGAIVLFAGHHAMAKATAFLGLGALASCSDRLRPLAWGGLVVVALTLAAAPFSSGAVAKSQLATALRTSTLDPIMLPALTLGGVATTLLMVRFLFLATEHRKAAGAGAGRTGFIAWLILVALVLTAPWWLMGADGPVAATWDQAWPVLAGGLIAVAAARYAPSRYRQRAVPTPWWQGSFSRAWLPAAVVLAHLERHWLRWPVVGRAMLLLTAALALLILRV